MLNWLADIDDLSSGALTLQAQAMSVDDVDRLLHPAFFPYTEVDSVEIDTIMQDDKRYASSYRLWNNRGRYIPQPTPRRERVEMIPLEGYDKVEEKEMQKLRERTLAGGSSNQALYRQLIQASIPGRVDKLVAANYRALERYGMEAWAKGQITYNLPETDEEIVFDFNFDSGRIQTASTPWDDAGTNAYADLVAWYREGESEVGPGNGVALRRSLWNAVRADAPAALGLTNVSVMRTADLQAALEDEFGSAFNFYVIEHSFDEFNDAGVATTRTKYWADGYAAFVPQGEAVGMTARAPVARAFDILEANAGDPPPIDVRGMTVYREIANGGRELTLECQGNYMPMPMEQKVWTINTGVTS